MDRDLDQLRRILNLALHSPYDGEKEKAVALLHLRLTKSGLRLRDLDAGFQEQDDENELRRRAGLAHYAEVTFHSHEEAALYASLLRQATGTSDSAAWLEGHRLLVHATLAQRQAADEAFAERQHVLHERLAQAQQQALREYHERRRALFQQAVDEVATAPLP
ncbi:hypothetical protein RDMS_08850 [Deinococcus sp. RL]|uniref:hypothetical protein n=1 Tax=Deinococcus sp. RL TaxID=1489678 RepID=UPI0004D9629D|nr:hypothetical protein [Deinococcus sp. RL]KEF34107.1 hypothetical protein RDMS_08850 [Deinococcus sp. RL]